MIEQIKIKNNTLLSQILIPRQFNFSRKINLLFGANGVGKSTLIQALLGNKNYKKQFESKISGSNPLVYSYIDSIQNAKELSIKNPHLSYNDFFDPHIIARKFDAGELSEGQSIIYTVQEFLYCARQIEDSEHALFLVDEIDSGLSVDNIIWFCDELKQIVDKKENIQFIIAFNNYEFCNQFKTVISMYTGEQIEIDTYEDYKRILLENRKRLLKLRKYNQFQKFE